MSQRKTLFRLSWIDEGEIAEVMDALGSRWLPTGPMARSLERKAVAYVEPRTLSRLSGGYPGPLPPSGKGGA